MRHTASKFWSADGINTFLHALRAQLESSLQKFPCRCNPLHAKYSIKMTALYDTATRGTKLVKIKIDGVAYDAGEFSEEEKRLLTEFQSLNSQIQQSAAKHATLTRAKTILTAQLKDRLIKKSAGLI